MLAMIDTFQPMFAAEGMELTTPRVVQTLSVEELKELLPSHDGWIIGDDPANRDVFAAGKAGRLKAAVKWGIGIDNVDFAAAREFGIPISNTPLMFGGEVADVAMAYVISLARETVAIHKGVSEGYWPKPRGISLAGRILALVGFGDIGRNVARRALAAGMKVVAYDPVVTSESRLTKEVEIAAWPDRIGEADFIVFTCSLTPANYHMLNAAVLNKTKPGVRIVNVARGPLIDEDALIDALHSRRVHSVALDVFEIEPLPMCSPLRRFEQNVFGSHNASNTEDAVIRASHRAIELLIGFLRERKE